HIIDPRTGLPAGGPWRTVTVVAGSCVDANTAATAAIVLGDTAVERLEAARLPARLVDQAGGVTRVAGRPAPGWLHQGLAGTPAQGSGSVGRWRGSGSMRTEDGS